LQPEARGAALVLHHPVDVDAVLAHPENGRGSALHFKQEGACSAAAPHRIVLLPPAGQAAEAAAESIPLLLWLLQ